MHELDVHRCSYTNLLNLHIFPPIMFLLESQLLQLLIRQRSIPLTHLLRDRHIRTRLLQELFRRYRSRNSVIRRIEDLVTQS